MSTTSEKNTPQGEISEDADNISVKSNASGTSTKRAKSPTTIIKPATLTDVALQVPTTQSADKIRTRSTTPDALPTELIIKVRSQRNRLNSLLNLEAELVNNAQQTTLEEILRLREHVHDITKTFNKEHAYLEMTWPAAHLDHEYLTDNYLEQFTNTMVRLELRMGRLKTVLTVQPISAPSSQPQQSSSQLPKLPVPSFSGNYLEWSSFSELFTSVIIDHPSISNIERLQYLRGSLTGEPLKLISSLPLNGDSFQPAWENLQQRYQNKRVIMQSQFDKLLSITPMKQRNAASLDSIISTVRDVDISLQPLATPEERWNALLIHLAIRNLDKATREAWETRLGSSQEFPPKQELMSFITSKIRALESVESTTSGSKTTSRNASTNQRSSHTATQAQPQQPRTHLQRYPCDCCNEDHFIISCQKFRSLTVSGRRRLVTNAKLCWNCCGRHPIANCKSSHRCKECNDAHHTLLHIDSQPSSRTQSQSAEAAPSTSQQH